MSGCEMVASDMIGKTVVSGEREIRAVCQQKSTPIWIWFPWYWCIYIIHHTQGMYW